ncbi:MAG: pantoate--beta-alanine ligase [Haliscomenobacteraceae bacterium CHB4]|nr:pantoate--beta-alanine ligase [Haliscomenobacteraceae bacterium CHB4]
MLLFKKVADLQSWLDSQRAKGDKIGFAPTMGALHDGHLELIRMAKRDGCLAVASIFVNPTQFNDPKDLEKYPRLPEKDAALLLGAHCDALFMPPVEEVYPPGIELTIELDFRQLDKVMEGVFRPGHFKGMATVVKRLLDIVQPQRLYMGQKDFQQLSIVRDMIRQLQLPVELVMCPTVREADGLAMSSRNMRLTPEMRTIAPVIHKTLQWAKKELEARPATEIGAEAMQRLSEAGLQPEYFDIVDGISLLPVARWAGSDFIVACTAAFAGEVRLIDNLVLKG